MTEADLRTGPYWHRLPLLALGGATLILGLLGGLARLDWWTGQTPAGGMASHGVLLIGGFLGTLIGLERAVAVQHRVAYLVPLLAGLGGLVLVSGRADGLAMGLLVGASLGFTAIAASLMWRLPGWPMALQLAGGLAWLGMVVLWWSGEPARILGMWGAAFLMLTVIGERMELALLLRISPAKRSLVMAAIAVTGIGLVSAPLVFETGWRVAGLGWLMFAVVLGPADVQARLWRRGGEDRYGQACLAAAWIWLGLGGVLALAFAPDDRWWADAVLHAWLVGYVFSMIFAHAHVVLTGVLGLRLPHHAAVWVPFTVLQASVLARIVADIGLFWELRRWASLLSAVAIVLFIIIAAARARPRPPRVAVESRASEAEA